MLSAYGAFLGFMQPCDISSYAEFDASNVLDEDYARLNVLWSWGVFQTLRGMELSEGTTFKSVEKENREERKDEHNEFW
ncbi:hypothetical protein AXF42_Ash012444 [Apostasia shenzhenica]|uniref:Uncharacterized protein n=1 Tax=Apostasia shenzhenica TaxID=1088818 RepID=A0A2I0AQS3_9ASPA|nr:hypothetical protein AXF42_Ash012444 [Apostasia shenzhenica]